MSLVTSTHEELRCRLEKLLASGSFSLSHFSCSALHKMNIDTLVYILKGCASNGLRTGICEVLKKFETIDGKSDKDKEVGVFFTKITKNNVD